MFDDMQALFVNIGFVMNIFFLVFWVVIFLFVSLQTEIIQ